MRKIARIKEVFARIKRLLGLSINFIGGVAKIMHFKITAANNKRHPRAMKDFDENIRTSFFIIILRLMP